jgi:hypothetical protein
MQIQKMFATAATTAVGLSTLTNAAAVFERETGRYRLLSLPSLHPLTLSATDSAVVIVQHIADVSTSTAYSTSEVTVWACGSTVTDCPSDSSTSLVSIVTAVTAVSTTICPLTVTSVTTSGVPGTNSGPLSTVTLSGTSTVYTTLAPSASSASSATGPSSVPGSSGTDQVTLHSTVTSMQTVTVPATGATTSLSGLTSSLTGTLVVSSQPFSDW